MSSSGPPPPKDEPNYPPLQSSTRQRQQNQGQGQAQAQAQQGQNSAVNGQQGAQGQAQAAANPTTTSGWPSISPTTTVHSSNWSGTNVVMGTLARQQQSQTDSSSGNGNGDRGSGSSVSNYFFSSSSVDQMSIGNSRSLSQGPSLSLSPYITASSGQGSSSASSTAGDLPPATSEGLAGAGALALAGAGALAGMGSTIGASALAATAGAFACADGGNTEIWQDPTVARISENEGTQANQGHLGARRRRRLYEHLPQNQNGPDGITAPQPQPQPAQTNSLGLAQGAIPRTSQASRLSSSTPQTGPSGETSDSTPQQRHDSRLSIDATEFVPAGPSVAQPPPPPQSHWPIPTLTSMVNAQMQQLLPQLRPQLLQQPQPQRLIPPPHLYIQQQVQQYPQHPVIFDASSMPQYNNSYQVSSMGNQQSAANITLTDQNATKAAGIAQAMQGYQNTNRNFRQMPPTQTNQSPPGRPITSGRRHSGGAVGGGHNKSPSKNNKNTRSPRKSPGNGQARRLSDQDKGVKICEYCQKNGENSEQYTSHQFKLPLTDKIICPLFRKQNRMSD